MWRSVILVVLSIGLVIAKRWACPTLSNAITQEDILHAAEACNQAYYDNVVEETQIKNTPYKVIKKIEENLHTDAGIRVLVADHGNTRMIIYRGTDGNEQLMKEGASLFQKRSEVRFGDHEVEINKFFWDAFELGSYALRPFFTDPSKKYIITGHSLGGALASILALQTTHMFGGSAWKNPKSSLITFGQPRVGDAAYAELHDSLISTYRKLRFVNKADLVTKLPLRSLGYRHHSRAVYMGQEKIPKKGWWIFGDEPRNPRWRFNNDQEEDEEDESLLDEDAELLPLRENMEEDMIDEEQQDVGMRDYWKICSTPRAFFCVLSYKHIIPSMKKYHGIALYIRSIKETHLFKNQKGTETTKFNEDLVATCKKLQG